MNRRQLKQFCKDTLNEDFGSAGSDSPFAWDLLLNQATDELCRATDALWMDFLVTVTAGKSTYSCVPLYKIRRVQVSFPQGNYTKVRNLEIQQPTWIPYSFGESETSPQLGIPGVCAVNGTKQIVLYPVPNYTRPGALKLTGYGVPGDSWPGEDDECPLPDWSHLAVAYGAMISRAIKVRMAPDQLALLRSEYSIMRGKLESEAATNTRAKALQIGDGLDGYSRGSNPLNL